MRISLHGLARLLGGLMLATVTLAISTEIPPHGKAIVLFDGRDLQNFDVFLKDHGLNADPDHVFSVEKGVLHVSGKEFGYVITKQEFSNYYLSAEFKWARARMRLARARHATAEFFTMCKARRKFGRPPSSFRSSKAAPETFG